MRSRKVKPVKTGVAAEALVFLSMRSRILVTVPPKVMAAEPRSLFCVLSKISVFAAVAVMVEAPVILRTPLCDNGPPTVAAKVPLIVEAPKIKALLSVTLTLLALLMASVAKLLAAFSVMSLALPAPMVARPLTVIAALCVIAPLLARVKLPTA